MVSCLHSTKKRPPRACYRTRDSQGGFWSGPKEDALSMGMAAYFPYSSLANGYSELAWARDSRWDEFVLWMNQP